MHISQENVRCIMGYIVNLTVILSDIIKHPDHMQPAVTESLTEYTHSSTSVGMTKAARAVMDNHVESGRRDSIHRDIRSFVAETFSIRFATPQKDLVLENIVSLIRRYCALPNS